MCAIYSPVVSRFFMLIGLLSVLANSVYAVEKTSGTLPDFAQYTDVKAKKKAFFSFLEPLVAQSNKAIKVKQTKLNKLAKKTLNSNDLIWLDKLAKTYKVKATTPKQQIEQLLPKVDTIPISLALAQAANESAWGTSRFARQANNLFGQWCFRKGCGLVPKSRPKGAKYEVRKFNSPLASVKAYMLNLNSHHPYTQLRDIRSCLQANDLPVTGMALTNGLINYSIKKQAYIRAMQSMIRVNKLEKAPANPVSQASNPCHSISQVNA